MVDGIAWFVDDASVFDLDREHEGNEFSKGVNAYKCAKYSVDALV